MRQTEQAEQVEVLPDKTDETGKTTMTRLKTWWRWWREELGLYRTVLLFIGLDCIVLAPFQGEFGSSMMVGMMCILGAVWMDD
jgi:hypothetical protein